ncbi:MAG: RidA family protein [Acidobacteriaceae bacterium]|nr:RidA family protein [Acidobacteriaceae bacterium]
MKIAAWILCLPLLAASAGAQTTVKHIQPDEKMPIATGVWAGDTYYLSGQVASPANADAVAKGAAPVYGDTQAQALSVFTKIQASLRAQGLEMKDVVKMTVFLVGDPAKGGKMDFPGLQASYTRFFGTAEQPNKPARSAVQVAGLVVPWGLLEVEVIAVRSK